VNLSSAVSIEAFKSLHPLVFSLPIQDEIKKLEQLVEPNRLSSLHLWHIVVEVSHKQVIIQSQLIHNFHQLLNLLFHTIGFRRLPSCELF